MGNFLEFVLFASAGCVALAVIGAAVEWAEGRAKRRG